jgi:predicted nucleotidyltransferase
LFGSVGRGEVDLLNDVDIVGNDTGFVSDDILVMWSDVFRKPRDLIRDSNLSEKDPLLNL